MFDQLAEKLTVGGIILLGAEVIALVTVFNVLLSTRSAAGAWGWGMALLAFPLVAVPVYWVFGRREFNGYGERRREVLHNKEDLLSLEEGMTKGHHKLLKQLAKKVKQCKKLSALESEMIRTRKMLEKEKDLPPEKRCI